jgi:hypothetical protein
MRREPEEWGGAVRLPIWLRRLLRRADPAPDTPERAHEARTGGGRSAGGGHPADPTGGAPVEVLGPGSLSDLHRERRR